MALTPDGTAIRELREVCGWRLRPFAAAIAISHGYLSKIENGHGTNVSPEVLHRIADKLDVPLAALIGDRREFKAAHNRAIKRPRNATAAA